MDESRINAVVVRPEVDQRPYPSDSGPRGGDAGDLLGPADEKCSKCSATGDAVHRESVRALEPPQRAFRASAEVSVDGQDGTATHKQELCHRDVPAQCPPPQRPPPEAGPPKGAESEPRRRTDPPVDMQTRSSLKTSKAAGRRGAVHGVDRSEVEAVCTERDLKRCDLRPRGGSRSRPSGDGHEEREQARRAPQCASRFDAERLTPWGDDLATGSTRVVAGSWHRRPRPAAPDRLGPTDHVRSSRLGLFRLH